MTEYLELHHDAIQSVERVVNTLKYYSYLHLGVGNEKLSSEFMAEAQSLDRAKDNLSKAFTMLFKEYTNAGQQSSINVVKAALSGAEVALRDKDNDE